jgi:hypothetical protein
MNENAQLLRDYLARTRSLFDAAFSADTAAPGTQDARDSRPNGHCAIAAIFINRQLGGEFVSATLSSGVSHWFNRIRFGGEWFDVDLTGDQFGEDPVRVGSPNSLWAGTRSRSEVDINADTWRRHELFSSRVEVERDIRTAERAERNLLTAILEGEV